VHPLIIVLILIYGLFLALAHISFKLGTKQPKIISASPWFLGYGLLACSAVGIYFIILSHLNLHLAFSASRGVSYVFMALFSAVLLKEKMTLKSSLGIIALIIGLILIT